MKLKKIEALPVPRTRKRGWCVKAQLCEDVLVLDATEADSQGMP